MSRFSSSTRLDNMAESATLKMAQMARDMAAKGHDIINLSLGEPDFDTPQHIKDAAIEAIQQGFTKYTPVPGFLDLRESIAAKFLRDNGLPYKASQVMVSNGSKQCFANLCFALLNPGDEVVIFAPYWISYHEIVALAEGKPIHIYSSVENDYKISAAQLEQAISPRTKMLIFSSPCNPTGTVFTKDDLESYAEVLRKHPNILVVADEIYEHIIFDEKHVSIASLPEMFDRSVTINGFSKGFSMTGWRLGYMAGPQEVVDACIKVQGQFTSGSASFTQRAGLFALQSNLNPTLDMCDAFQRRRDLIYDRIKMIPHIKVNFPKGAFYLLPDVSYYYGKEYNNVVIKNGDDLAEYLLQHAHIAVVSGEKFGAPNCIRISYSISDTRIIEAMDRMQNALSAIDTV